MTTNCPHCGARLFGLVSTCPKCQKPVEVAKEAEAARTEAHSAEVEKRAADPKLRREFRPLIDALNASKASVFFPTGLGEEYAYATGEEGWVSFVDHCIERFTCAKCPRCGHVVARSFRGDLDTFIRRGDGTAGADNWIAFWECPSCQADNRRRVVVSLDTMCPDNRSEGDPLADVFRRQSVWRRIFRR